MVETDWMTILLVALAAILCAVVIALIVALRSLADSLASTDRHAAALRAHVERGEEIARETEQIERLMQETPPRKRRRRG